MLIGGVLGKLCKDGVFSGLGICARRGGLLDNAPVAGFALAGDGAAKARRRLTFRELAEVEGVFGGEGGRKQDETGRNPKS